MLQAQYDAAVPIENDMAIIANLQTSTVTPAPTPTTVVDFQTAFTPLFNLDLTVFNDATIAPALLQVLEDAYNAYTTALSAAKTSLDSQLAAI